MEVVGDVRVNVRRVPRFNWVDMEGDSIRTSGSIVSEQGSMLFKGDVVSTDGMIISKHHIGSDSGSLVAQYGIHSFKGDVYARGDITSYGGSIDVPWGGVKSGGDIYARNINAELGVVARKITADKIKANYVICEEIEGLSVSRPVMDITFERFPYMNNGLYNCGSDIASLFDPKV